jgi:hypothetical protein
MKKASEMTWTKNKEMVKPLFRWLLSLYTLLYLLEKIKLAKSPNLFSKTDFVTAIIANDRTKSTVAQSLLSVILG